uniref:Kinesin 14-V protein n=1 Tax=Marsilea vestita TaxID=59764 RepID=A0A142KWD4_MARVE|nr:kinesin 14-V protein [Marsilea vestita]
MADASSQRSAWGWDMPTYDPRKSFEIGRSFQSSDDNEEDDDDVAALLDSTAASGAHPNSISRRLSLPILGANQKHASPAIANELLRLYQQISVSRAEMLELRQEASDLQEYSNAKILRVTRYLGVLADKSHKLDQTVLETEAQLSSLRKEKRKLFNSLVGVKGNIRVYCRVRPQFEHEGPSVTEFPDDFLIRVNTASLTANPIGLPKKEFELDRVYGPHVGQGDFFQDVQPFVQSALDGYNVCVFAYGQSGSGKTYTMEGPSNDWGVFFRAFEELFDLSNNDMTSTSKFSFAMSIFELNNEIRDLLLGSTRSMGTVQMGYSGKPVELTQERVENPIEFSRIYKSALQGRSKDASANPAHLVLTIHIRYTNSFSGESYYSKLSMVDMVASESLSREDAIGDRLTELLHINKSFSALGDVLSALTAKKEYVPYGNSKLTQILADSLGGDAKTLLIVNLSPCQNDVQETVSSLQFAARARNVELSLGNRDTIKKWRDMANETRKELYEKEKEISEMHQQLMELKKRLKDADDQCLLLFNEVQKAWKVAFTLQSDHKSQTASLVEKEKVEREQNIQLRAQIQQLTKSDQDQKAQLQEYKDKVQQLERKVQELNQLVAEARPQSTASTPREGDMFGRANLRHVHRVDDVDMQQGRIESEATKRLEEELAKRDELIERLHEENEKLFGRLTERSAPAGSPRVQKVESKGVDNFQLDPSSRPAGGKPPVSPEVRSTAAKMESSSGALTVAGNMALVKSGSEKIKTTPAGEYLTSALNDFNPDQSDGSAAADGANKLLMLVLAAVIKAGAAREHEMLAEIRSAVFAFIRKMEPLRVMDTMLVSRVRILYIRSLLSRSPELQSIKVPAVERFLEKVGSGSSTRRGSRGSSPARSPMRYESNLLKDLIDEHVQGFKVHIKQERKSKFSSIVLKLRGIDQETWRQHVTGGKLRETTEEARNYAIGNKALAALFVHTPAGELQRQIRSWLAENFDFLSLSGGDGVNGTAGQLELLSTAIMDGWMSGLGVPQRPSTDALGQLLSDYTKRMYTSQLQHLKDVAATLATEEAEDPGQIAKLRSALESVEHKRRKVLQQMRSDVALLTKEEGGSPIRNPSTASEDARIASLMSLEDIVKHAEEIKREAPVKAIFVSRKQAMLSALQALSERMPSLLSIDHPCAQKHILDAKNVVESISEQHEGPHHTRGRAAGSDVPGEVSSMSGDWGDSAMFGPDGDVMQWSVLQFNNGSANPFVIKCGANSSLELVVKAQAKVQDKTGKEIIAVVPAPSTLAGLSLEEIKQVLARLPEAFGQLALARTADGTRARYARLYKTLAIRVPALKSSIPDVDREHSRELSTTSLSFQRRVD